MAKTFRDWDVDQIWLLPPSVHELVPKGHIAHFVRDTVSPLDLGFFFTLTTDDYPKVEVTVIFESGEQWTARSDAQSPFMIPWTIHGPLKSFDARIGRMIADWLPARGLNRDRLSGWGLADWIGMQVPQRLPGE